MYRKQKAAVRIISNSSYRAHTEPIFQQFNILPLPSLIEFFKLQFMQLPPSFNNVWFTNETRRTETVYMSLRNSDDFFIPVSSLKCYEKMPLYSFPKAWSLLTGYSIVIIRNCAEFNAKLKEHFLSKLSFTVNCTVHSRIHSLTSVGWKQACYAFCRRSMDIC